MRHPAVSLRRREGREVRRAGPPGPGRRGRRARRAALVGRELRGGLLVRLLRRDGVRPGKLVVLRLLLRLVVVRLRRRRCRGVRRVVLRDERVEAREAPGRPPLRRHRPDRRRGLPQDGHPRLRGACVCVCGGRVRVLWRGEEASDERGAEAGTKKSPGARLPAVLEAVGRAVEHVLAEPARRGREREGEINIGTAGDCYFMPEVTLRRARGGESGGRGPRAGPSWTPCGIPRSTLTRR